MQNNIFQALREGWSDFVANHADTLRHLALAVLGAVGRLFYNHKQFDGVNVQLFYELFRGVIMAFAAVVLVDSVVAYFCIVGVFGSASAVAAGFYAMEIMGMVKELIPAVRDKIGKVLK